MSNLTWTALDGLTRAQLTMFKAMSDDLRLTEEERCRVLGLDVARWQAWSVFADDGPLPADADLPDMVLRVGQATYAASVMAELATHDAW